MRNVANLYEDPAAIFAGTAGHYLRHRVRHPGMLLDGAHLLLHLTEWPDYQQADPACLVQRPAAAHLIDARARLDHARWEAAGWHTQSLGVSTHTTTA